jgi:hypothetical protein
MDVDGSSLAAAALYDMKNEQLQLANSALQQHVGGERSQQIIPSDNKQQETSVSTTTDQSVATTMEGGHHFGEGGRKKRKCGFCFIIMIILITETGPEIPFEIGQFLLYKGHFLNLLHFPIWKVHTKTLLLKYDTVLADSEIAWEATDEVRKSIRVFCLIENSILFVSVIGNVLYKRL